MTARRALLAAFSTALLLGLAWGCAAADDADSSASGGGASNSNVDASSDGQVITSEAGPDDSGGLGLNPLCGMNHSCVPDLPSSCGDFEPPLAPSDAGAAAAAGKSGMTGEGGAGGDSAGPTPGSGSGGEGGMSGAAGAAGAAGSAGTAGGPALMYSCQVQRAASAPDTAFSACAPAGVGAENAPCLTAKDCQPGLGCVGDQSAGKCLRYCCQDADDCASGTYCAEQPMRDATTNALAKDAANTSPMIPVCVHAENCDLSAPYPCPKGGQCACESGTACLVVRSDGTTTCAVPGSGKVGEACPCAWGHICSAASNQCLKLCYTRDSDTCGDGKCQSASELPDGWGVCVGLTSNGG